MYPHCTRLARPDAIPPTHLALLHTAAALSILYSRRTFEFFNLFGQFIHLCLELFIFLLECIDIDILWSTNITLNVIDGIGGPFWFFVQAHQYFGEGINDTRLFQIFTKLFLFIVGVIIGLQVVL